MSIGVIGSGTLGSNVARMFANLVRKVCDRLINGNDLIGPRPTNNVEVHGPDPELRSLDFLDAPNIERNLTLDALIPCPQCERAVFLNKV